MLTPIDTEAALAASIRAVLTDNALRNRIIAGGYAEYQTNFTRESVTRQWITYYKSLLRR
jgi:glycosyltransferase involved in cell wall biosynthesis